jgi:hypothetical protein
MPLGLSRGRVPASRRRRIQVAHPAGSGGGDLAAHTPLPWRLDGSPCQAHLVGDPSDHGAGPGGSAAAVGTAGAQRTAVFGLVFVEEDLQRPAGVLNVLPSVREEGVVVGAAGGVSHCLQPHPKPLLHGEARRVWSHRGQQGYSAGGPSFGMAAESIAAHTVHLLA